MSFPQTRHTLIQRIARGGDESDWQQFFSDYWGPVCRFARRSGKLSADDAEDVAAQSLEIVVRNQLLTQWILSRSAKLRTLLCAVVRNVLCNRARVLAGRARLLRDHGGRLEDRAALPVLTTLDAPAEQVDAFYAAWAEDLLRQAVEGLLDHYHREGRGDFFRVLYGRLCDAMTMPEIAEALGIAITQAENAFKHARKGLAERLEGLVRAHVERYCAPDDVEGEFSAEWAHLGDYLGKHGGLEAVVRRVYEGTDLEAQKQQSASRKRVIRACSEQWMRPMGPSPDAAGTK